VYTDTAADASLSSTAPHVNSNFGGAIDLNDASGNANLKFRSNGNIVSTGNVSAASLTITGDSLIGGRIGKTVAGDIIDASGNDTYVKARNAANNIFFQVPNGTSVAKFNSGGLDMLGNAITSGNITSANVSTGNIALSNGLNLNGGALNLFNGAQINAANLVFNGTGMLFASAVQLNGNLLLQPGNAATPSGIVTGNAGFGFKMNNGTRLLEVKSSGAGVLLGSWTTGGTGFDSFDIAESYYVDQIYPFGTVLCSNSDTMPIPSDQSAYNPTLTKCTHDGCNECSIISQNPSNIMGQPNVPGTDGYDSTQPLAQPVALAGRIYVKTAYDIPARAYVCSDGRGGVRAVTSGEKIFALGVTLGPSSQGIVPITLRNTFVSL
jgi:hypothetical protein